MKKRELLTVILFCGFLFAMLLGYLLLPKAEFSETEKRFLAETPALRWDAVASGDWGTEDAGGYFTLKSRKKELINVGGKKVSPMEVEAVLLELDEIADCACVAVPDEQGILGEVVKAFVVTAPGAALDEAAVTAYAAKHLESYKVPAVYERIDAIPKTSSGKVQRLSLIGR